MDKNSNIVEDTIVENKVIDCNAISVRLYPEPETQEKLSVLILQQVTDNDPSKTINVAAAVISDKTIDTLINNLQKLKVFLKKDKNKKLKKERRKN